jgi:uncharacterized membrane protein YphA (DoxX/SURF4 family)
MNDRRATIAEWAATIARVLLGGVWIVAGYAKLADADAAVKAVRAYRILPEGLVKAFAWGLPFVEIALGVLLVAGLAHRVAAAFSFVVLVVFVAAIASAWARGLRIECGCFGGGGVSAHVDGWSYAKEIARDLVLAGVALFVALGPGSRFALDNVGRQ